MKYLASLLFVALLLFSCEKATLPEDLGQSSNQGKPASLTMTTRTGDPENTIKEGRIYVFNSSGQCVQLLSIDANNTSVTAQLPAGSYSVYAVGGEDLSHFVLPSITEATPTSIITRQTGKLMNELLLKSTNITLAEGDERNLEMTLDRKVLCIDEVVMTQMPADVTKVEVTLSPIYSTLSFDGTYPDTPVESYRIALVKQDDGTTWSATPAQMLFPSKGTPVVTVTVTTTSGSIGFSYTAAAMLVNKHYTVSGTYSVSAGVSLSFTLTASGWDEDGSIDFNLDNDHQVVYTPVAGQFCNGYYCVSVNASNRTAVLLAKNKLSYIAPSDGDDVSAWVATITPLIAALDKPAGTTNDWRLPTFEEAASITQDTNVVTYNEFGRSTIIFYTADNALRAGWSTVNNSTYTFHWGGSGFKSNINLRPVIDINY